MLCSHVDDLKVAEPPGINRVKQALSNKFPIEDWEAMPYTYTGSQYRKEAEDILIGQAVYVENRLEMVDTKRGRQDVEEANPTEYEDNMSAIGGIGWLAAQSGTDLARGCSMAQKRQKAPTVRDLKLTKKLVKMAQEYKDLCIRRQKLKPNDMCLIMYHDAAWANVQTLESVAEPTQEQIDSKEVYSQIGYARYMCKRKVMNGYPGRASLVEAAIAWRGYLVELLYPNVELRDIDVNLLSILTVTDCRPLYDTMHREGAAKALSEKRFCVDLAATRQMHEHEVIDSSPLEVGAALSV